MFLQPWGQSQREKPEFLWSILASKHSPVPDPYRRVMNPLGKITVHNVLCQEHAVVCLLLLSCLVLPSFNSSFRKGVQKDRATHRNSLFISFAQDFVWVCTHTQIHTHTHKCFETQKVSKTALLLLFISIKDTIKIY